MNEKTKITLIINVVAGLIVTIFVLIAYGMYSQHKQFLTTEIKRCGVNAVHQMTTEAIMKNSRGFASSREDSSFLIVRDNIQYICKYDPLLSINENLFRATYDICNPTDWQTERLGTILRDKISGICPPFILTRTDSLDRKIDSWKYDMENRDSLELNLHLVFPLGFLDKHRLTIHYAYTWKNFLKTEGGKLSVIFALLSLVTLSLGLFTKLLRVMKKKAENQELFVQALNHDLKSPLAALQMKMFRIKSCSPVPYSSEQEKLYTDTLFHFSGLFSSIDRLLQDSIDARGIRLDLQRINLPKLIEEQVTALLAAIGDKKQVTVETSFQLADPVILADTHHLSRVMTNLLENAVKYSGEKVSIRINCMDEGAFVRIVLQDDGNGIAKPDLKHIFEKNYRPQGDREKKVKGFGLGLSYVKMIIRAHRGYIRAESEAGKGTTFIIRLRHGRKN